MKLNKFKTIAPAAALLLSASLSSCMADLDKGNIDPNVAHEADLTGLYSKCYAGLIMEGNDGSPDFTIPDGGKSTLIRNMYYFNELPTDESICWWSDGGLTDISYNQYNAGTETLNYFYYRIMTNIAYENAYLNLDAAKEDKTRYAEVRVIRAFHYLLLLDFWGDPAFSLEASSKEPLQAHAYNEKFEQGKAYTRAELLQMGREFLFKWVEKELLAAEPDLLPAKWETDNDPDYGRVDQGACWLLLSRLYLNAGTYLNNDGQDNPYWQQALTYAEQTIAKYPLFDDSKMTDEARARGYQPYDLLFMGDNGSNGASCEAILPLLQDGITTQGWGGSVFYIATSIDSETRTVTGQTFGTTYTDWSGMRVRPAFLAKFTPNPKNFQGKTAAEIRAMNIDDRALFWGAKSATDSKHSLDLGNNDSFSSGICVVKWNNNYSNGGTPHDNAFADTDFFLFRVAEAYLNAAEA
ncbi:RagB/SusD family nutrient uptake outer membrane protein, partial [Prevotella sp.]|uniref:RagB/SusD family nutrient uptake outer membrane protein n=1 Tax=Prevotella sp. TaxID=59823 RepID=UPI003F8123BA